MPPHPGAPGTHDKGTHQDRSGPRVHDDRSHTSHGPSHRHSRASGGAAVSPAAALTPPALAPMDPDDATTTATSSGVPGFGGSAGLNLDPATVAALSQTSSLLATGNQPPAFLIPIYKAAAHRYHVPWQILAAMNWIETNYGANLNTSSADAMGWMQFTPGTWQRYGVAADGQSKPNPHSALDAIFSAAHFLAANGAARNLSKAIYAYNHATWYAADVVRHARMIRDHAHARADPPFARTRRTGLAGAERRLSS